MSITLVSFSEGYVTGVEPTIPAPYSTLPGDVLVIYFATNRACGVRDTYGLSYLTVDTQVMGTLCDALYVRVLTGAEGAMQAYALADDPVGDRFFAVPGPYLVLAFRGCDPSQFDGWNSVQSPSAHIMQFPDAISTRANDAIVLLGCCASVLAALDTDSVAGYTMAATARDANRGANAFWKIQPGAGHTGVPNGSHSVGTNLICHTLCLFLAPPPPDGGGGGGGPPPTSTRAKSRTILT